MIGVCLLRNAGPGFLAGCERVIGSLQLSGGRVLGLGPSGDLAAGLSAAFKTLNAVQATAGAGLRSARSARAQARAAAQLAAGYDQAATAIDRLDPVPTAAGATDALVRALRHTAGAYATLAHAAGRNDARGYEAARGTIRSAGAATTAALQQFARLGYTVG